MNLIDIDFIDGNQFLDQPIEVQEALKKYHEKYHKRANCKGIPIMSETELRKFIEHKTGCKFQINYDGDYGYSIEIGYTDSFAIHYYGKYTELGHDLLQAYWKVACEVALD